MSAPKEWLTAKDVAELIGCSRMHVYNMVKRYPEKIPHFKFGDYIKFPPDIIDYLTKKPKKRNENEDAI